MAKIMLVEDDNNLREIYGARLLAEGYEIVSAKDGEEALAMAVKEKPDLIISDIMMPKISGFDMLDILRSTAETKHTKVIMMTALSQIEDKERADRLGADRYLVKSQVTLEDVATAAREVLNDTDAGQIDPLVPAPVAAGSDAPAEPVTAEEPAPAAETPTEEAPEPTPVAAEPAAPTPTPTPVPVTEPAPVADTPAPVASDNDQVLADAVAALSGAAAEPAAPTPTPTPVPVTEPAPVADTPAPVNPVTTPTSEPAATVSAPQSSTEPSPAPESTAAPIDQPAPVIAPGGQSKTSVHTKVITPINDMTAPGPDLNALLAAEEAKTAAAPAPVAPAAPAQIINDITPAPATIAPAAPAEPTEPVTPATPTPPITIKPLV